MHRLFFLVALVCIQWPAQAQTVGPHERQSKQQPGAEPNKLYLIALSKPADSGRVLTHKVMGYHPYWRSDDNIQRYRFDLLSHVVYFSAGVDPNTGNITSSRDWITTPLVEAAQAAGCKVHLCVTNFGAGNNLRLLQNKAARDTLIAQLIRLVAVRGGDGINLDFENMPEQSREDLVTFCRDLDLRLGEVLPDAEISSAMPAVDWNNAWDVAELSKHIDLFFLMCYDYYWTGAASAGPVSPLQGSAYNVARTVRWYIDNGVPKEQLLMGVPYYGIDWPVVSESPNAATEAKGTAYIYASVQNALNLHDRLWSPTFLNPWYRYRTASYWHQAWYDDVESLGYKYDFALQEGIGGIGMWALSYDDGYDELWELIEEKFTAPVAVQGAPEVTGFALGEPWPNPVGAGSPVVSVPYAGAAPGDALALRVTDRLGRTVYTTMEPVRNQSGIITIPVADLAAGTYIVNLRGQGTARIFHLVR